jgi:hypothetical protein
MLRDDCPHRRSVLPACVHLPCQRAAPPRAAQQQVLQPQRMHDSAAADRICLHFMHPADLLVKGVRWPPRRPPPLLCTSCLQRLNDEIPSLMVIVPVEAVHSLLASKGSSSCQTLFAKLRSGTAKQCRCLLPTVCECAASRHPVNGLCCSSSCMFQATTCAPAAAAGQLNSRSNRFFGVSQGLST